VLPSTTKPDSPCIRRMGCLRNQVAIGMPWSGKF
jgi:hypothetical protein